MQSTHRTQGHERGQTSAGRSEIPGRRSTRRKPGRGASNGRAIGHRRMILQLAQGRVRQCLRLCQAPHLFRDRRLRPRQATAHGVVGHAEHTGVAPMKIMGILGAKAGVITPDSRRLRRQGPRPRFARRCRRPTHWAGRRRPQPPSQEEESNTSDLYKTAENVSRTLQLSDDNRSFDHKTERSTYG